MPHGPEHYCNHPTCSNLVRGRSRCPEHEKAARAEADAARDPRSRRSYKRARWVKGIRPRQLFREALCRRCRAAGRYVPATDVDHILPKSQGGSDAPRNLQSLCHAHHSQKTATEDGAFGRAPRPRGGDRAIFSHGEKSAVAGGGVGGGET